MTHYVNTYKERSDSKSQRDFGSHDPPPAQSFDFVYISIEIYMINTCIPINKLSEIHRIEKFDPEAKAARPKVSEILEFLAFPKDSKFYEILDRLKSLQESSKN